MKELNEADLDVDASVHAACHALTNLVPAMVLCAPTDISTEHKSQYQSRERPARYSSSKLLIPLMLFVTDHLNQQDSSSTTNVDQVEARAVQRLNAYGNS
jgi:hypothetical protein